MTSQTLTTQLTAEEVKGRVQAASSRDCCPEVEEVNDGDEDKTIRGVGWKEDSFVKDVGILVRVWSGIRLGGR